MPILAKLRQFLEQEKVPYTALEIAALEHVKGRMLAKVVAKLRFTDFARIVQPRMASLSVPIV